MTLANAHALFCGLKAEPSYLANLTIAEGDRSALMDARKQIRAVLKAAAVFIPTQDQYWDETYARQISRRIRSAIQLKFMTQGSFAYRTINSPAYVPVQEIDLDDGMYVPVDYLQNGQPALTARGLFEFVEAALAPLCTQNGWTLDQSYHENCVRIRLWPGAHIDIPIYSIPRDRFETITDTVEKAAALRSLSRDSLSTSWRIPSDQIMLAQRSGSWVPSDPQQMHEWVEGRCERYGPVYRRLCRFFKGWRDYSWKKTDLSSLCLMCAVDVALRQLRGFPTENRDDELILEVAKRLPSIFEAGIANPVIENLCLNEWTDETRREVVRAACALRDEMTAALEQTGDAEQVVRKIRTRFGDRVPYRPDVVRIASKIGAIQNAPAATVAAPRIISSTSG